jgi:ADP-ribose pyrophosphatase YjhB (NUDIX family)
MYPVRNSVKALIIRENMLLCIRNTDREGDYCTLPGGGQEKNETFVNALVRECKEEIGAEVEVVRIKFIREYIAKNHEFRDSDNNHQVEFMFECNLLEAPNIDKAKHLDEKQNGFEWIDLNGSKTSRVYPKVLIDRLRNKFEEIYWGDIN